MDSKLIKFRVEDQRIYALHVYTEFVKRTIVRYKDFGDTYLARIFLPKFRARIFFFYHDFCVVCVPSTHKSNAERGFDHCLLLAHTLGLVVLEGVLENRSENKQKEKKKSERLRIGESIALRDKTEIEGKKILLLDDVMTTGSTLRACIVLLIPYTIIVVGIVVAYVPEQV